MFYVNTYASVFVLIIFITWSLRYDMAKPKMSTAGRIVPSSDDIVVFKLTF